MRTILKESPAPGLTGAGHEQSKRQADTNATQPDGKQKLLPSDRFRPQAVEAGRQLIRSWCDYGPKAASLIDPAALPGLLADVGHGVLAAISEGARDFPGIFSHFIQAPQGIRDELIEANQGNSPLPENCGRLLAAVCRWNQAYRLDMAADKLRQALDRGDDPAQALAQIAAIQNGDCGKNISSQLTNRVFDFATQPEKPIPLFKLNEHPLCTAGNITNIQAPPKAGKSALVEAAIAAILNGGRQGPDTLGLTAENKLGHAVIHLDTEQSRFDHDALVRRAIRRARVTEPPPWLLSYSVADLAIADRRQALRHLMKRGREDCGGVLVVMIDGIGDLCADPNDSAEAFDLVHELHTLAITHEAVVLTVLHENPGSETGKTRGHLGSQIERKAETNLRLQKDASGITTVWADKARHCYLPKDSGACFQWDDEKRMHTSCGTAREIRSAATRDKMESEADAAFGGAAAKSYSELVDAIMDALDVSERTAKGRVKTWLAEGITRKDAAGKHLITNP